jgi:uncharacterized protein (TIGR00730 family)
MDEAQEEIIQVQIRDLLRTVEADPDTFAGQLVAQMIETALKLLRDKHDVGQLKVMNRSIREMRYAYSIFNRYREGPCVSIFGSARTPENDPDYLAAQEFSRKISEQGWMCISGGANGIMKAAIEGPKKERSFGLSIRLPFEAPANAVIEGDPKLIVFRYFFTRKLMFMSHSSAMATFPGGLGTMDELFEMLTLMQTGKANIIPIVLLEGPEGTYWRAWRNYVNENLSDRGYVSPEDSFLYYLAPSVDDAVQHILKFYARFHSYRYVKDTIVIRLLHPLDEAQLCFLNAKYGMLAASGAISAVAPLEEEDDHLGLPRIAFHHTKRDFSLLRLLIDDINAF